MEFLSEENEPITLIGLFTVTFATAEAGLDMCNAVLFKHCGGDSVEPAIPRSLNRKISFFRKCQDQCGVLSAHGEITARGRQIADTFSEIRDDRHFLIHGIGSSLLKDQAFSQLKIEHFKTSIGYYEKVISISEIKKLIERCFILTKDSLVYVLYLLRFMPADQLDKAARELGVGSSEVSQIASSPATRRTSSYPILPDNGYEGQNWRDDYRGSVSPSLSPPLRERNADRAANQPVLCIL